MITTDDYPRVSLSRAEAEILDAALLDERGRLRLLPREDYEQWSRLSLRAWCAARARYFLPTIEFVEWLRGVIGNVYALEVGAGCGDLGFHLGIQATDSYLQDSSAEMAFLYAALGQGRTRPGRHVAKHDALSAVRRFVPRVVVGAWCTQLYQEGDTEKKIGSSVYGIDEKKLLTLLRPGSRYISIGNKAVHGDKRLLELPHEELTPPGILSRAADPELDRVWIWSV